MNWQKKVADFRAGLTAESPSLATVFIRFGFFGSVGGGKSVTAGIFATGITPQGLIGWIDGEGRRSGYAIDQVADLAAKKYGGTKQQYIDRFKVVHVDPPFNPLKAVAAIEMLEEMGCKTIICDLMTQCWDSDGGYLDLKNEELDKMAGSDDKKRERSAASAAAHIKPWTHQKLVNKVNASKCHLVMLFQAKQKYNPKTFKPDDFVTPIQESGLTRTAIAVGCVEAKMVGEHPQGGFCTFSGRIEQGTKFTHHSILQLLPKNGEQFKFDHAEAIARWCQTPQGPGTLSPQAPAAQPKAQESIAPAPAPTGEMESLKKYFWKLTQSIHMGHKENASKVQQWAWDEDVIPLNATLQTLALEELQSAILKAEKKLKQPQLV